MSLFWLRIGAPIMGCVETNHCVVTSPVATVLPNIQLYDVVASAAEMLWSREIRVRLYFQTGRFGEPHGLRFAIMLDTARFRGTGGRTASGPMTLAIVWSITYPVDGYRVLMSLSSELRQTEAA